ncbi:MAG: hypothetical protein ABWK05_09070 [Pyrobaculum sp.]
MRAELKPQGAKLYRDGVWGYLAVALQQTLERGEELELPKGVSLLKGEMLGKVLK